MRNYYVDGQWNAICDRCGFKYKNVDLKKEWTGLMVCNRCWEPRHPQTLIRVPQEQINTPWARPTPENTYYTVNWTNVQTGIVQASVLANPGKLYFNVSIPGYAPRVFGDIGNHGGPKVISNDALLAARYASGGSGNTQAVNAYCAWMEQYMIADPTTYSAYLTLNTFSS